MIRAGVLALLLATPALADGTLEGRVVTFSVLTYDDPEMPIFVGRGQTVQVGRGVEFGLGPEGAQNGVDVAPVTVDIGPTRVEVRFDQGVGGQLLTARFNGYVLRFEADCALFKGVRIDPVVTNIPLLSDAITTETGTLYVNVAGLRYTRESRFALDIDVTDCPLS
jgi:hypothetical protein